MKTSLTLSIGFVLSTALHGQTYLNFPQLTATWVNTMYTVVPFPPPAQYTLSSVTPYCQTMEDTLINGLVYNQLFHCGGAYKGALRDDADRIWYVPGDSTQEFLLYDFTLEAGETASNVYFEANGQGMLTESLTIMDVQMDTDLGRKVQYLQPGGRWIEGIGAAWGLFTEPWVNVSNYDLRLECMSNSDTILYPLEAVGIGTCDWTMGLAETQASTPLDLFPNPTTDGFVQVGASGVRTAQGLELTTTDGRRIDLRYEVNGATILLDLSGLPPGMYFLRDRLNTTSITRAIVRL